MSKLTGELIQYISQVVNTKHLGKLQIVSHYQESVSCRKLRTMLEEVEDNQRLDAIFLKRVLDKLNEIEACNE